ncbi:MAG: TRAM domain-containing protein, partial [Silvanigrellaceae bacterium]|nr:TRAM domain-containing protein [Silvanigrellaceae bacterium]
MNETKKVTVLSLGTDGRGIARDENGAVLFVKHLLPHETGLVKVTAKHKNFSEAILVQLERKASLSDRIYPPPCRYFERCGGCTLQHLAEQKQTEWKIVWFFETLRRIGQWPAENIKHAQKIFAISFLKKNFYRRKVILHFDGQHLGFKEFHTHKIIDIENCTIAHPKINTLISFLQKEILNIYANNKHQKISLDIQLSLDEKENKIALEILSKKHYEKTFQLKLQNILAKNNLVTLNQEVEVKTPFLTHFTTHRSSFVQPHMDCIFPYSFFISDSIASYLKTLNKSDLKAWDLFCGSGLFTGIPYFIGKKCNIKIDCLGIEGVHEAIHSLNKNYQRIPCIQGTCKDVHAFLKDSSFLPEQCPDIVILDPPRTGLGIESTKKLVEL